MQTIAHFSPKFFSDEKYSLADAYQELPNPALLANHSQDTDVGHHLVVSPYTTLPHLLDLRTLEEPQRLLAKSLTLLQSTQDDYATAPYHKSFNWDAVVDQLRSLLGSSNHHWNHQYFYIVVFRSQIPPTTDRTHLIELDQKSHAEATRSGGLLKYWFGMPDQNGRNLATCTSLPFSIANCNQGNPHITDDFPLSRYMA